MKATFQNKLEDLYAFFNYLAKNTDAGKRVCKQALATRLIWMVFVALVMSATVWGVTGNWSLGLRALIILLVFSYLIILVQSNFKPRYYFGIEAYRKSTLMSQKDIAYFQLPKTIKVENEWIEVKNSWAHHRYRISIIDKIAITADFIFVHVGDQSCFIIPKRDFASENDFNTFSRELARLHEEYKLQSGD